MESEPSQPTNQNVQTAVDVITPPTPVPSNSPLLTLLLSRVLLSRLLLVATGASVLSTLAFIVYLLGTAAAHQSRASYAGWYTVGVIGLWVAEVFQILGVVTLLARWFSQRAAERKSRELVVLLISLIPYALVVVFLVTLGVYLRARYLDTTSAQTREAAQELKEQTVDTFIDAGANTSSNSAGGQPTQSASGRSASTQRAQEAVRRVIGPNTSQAISGPALVLALVTMCALLVSSVATVGVVLPSKGSAPGQSVTSILHTGPAIVSGTWALAMSDTSYNCILPGNTCFAEFVSQSDFLYPGPATVQLNGSAAQMSLTAPTLGPNDPLTGYLPTKVTGTLVGQTINLTASATSPSGIPPIGQTYVNYTLHFTGAVADAHSMQGTFTYDLHWENYTIDGGDFIVIQHSTGTWKATYPAG